jgi:hypothetical protein
VLDARSGQLLAIKSCQETFSQLQFNAGGQGLSYLLHKGYAGSEEQIELHRFDVESQSSRRIARYTHVPHAKVRPSQWRGSISPDGSLLVYQHDVMKPNITVVDGNTGQALNQIHWDEDYTALPVFFHPQNELLVIPLAKWNAHYNYGATRKLLLANPKTGQMLGTYELSHFVNQVQFHGDRLLLLDNGNSVGRITIGSPELVWTSNQAIFPQGINYYWLQDGRTQGVVTRSTGAEAEFRLLSRDGLSKDPQYTLDSGFSPRAIQGSILISEKQTNCELHTWVQQMNERFQSWFGQYFIPPVVCTVRYQDVHTGEFLTDVRFDQRHVFEFTSRRVYGSTRLASIYVDKDKLAVAFQSLFPMWTTRRIGLLAVMLTLLIAIVVRGVSTRRRSGALASPLRKRSRSVVSPG